MDGFEDSKKDMILQFRKDSAQEQMIEESSAGWVTFVLITFVILMIIMVSMQRAFNIPLYDVMARDRAYVEDTYGAGMSSTAKMILLVILCVMIYGLFTLFQNAGYDLAAFAVGGSYATRKANQFKEQDAKLNRAAERDMQLSRRQNEEFVRQVTPESVVKKDRERLGPRDDEEAEIDF